MLRSVEISAELTGPLHGKGFHNLHWDNVAAFDVTEERERMALRAVVDYWWAPFRDAKRGQAATALSQTPWIRLHLGYYCPQARQSGAFSIQTNMVRPRRDTCGHCDHLLATSKDAPTIRLLT
ncbi:hypothetical protein ACWD6Q_24810 [Streptomyces nigra]